jgi:hypothetical protein
MQKTQGLATHSPQVSRALPLPYEIPGSGTLDSTAAGKIRQNFQ